MKYVHSVLHQYLITIGESFSASEHPLTTEYNHGCIKEHKVIISVCLPTLRALPERTMTLAASLAG